MIMDKLPKNHTPYYVIGAIIFFFSGVITTYLYLNNFFSFKIAAISKTQDIEKRSPTVTPKPTISILRFNEITPTVKASDILTRPSGKFTVVESAKISTDKSSVQTGQQVNFSVTLQNQSSEKKFLTHICFNHSKGVTFGCLRNMNLEAGKEFNLNNSMIFTNPGSYSVWITWSQDHTNFYRPVNSGTVSVNVD